MNDQKPKPEASKSPQEMLVIVRDGLPVWWNEEDTEACLRHHEWETTDWYRSIDEYDDIEEYFSCGVSEQEQAAVDEWCDKHIDKFICRRCSNWKSSDGKEGYCKALDRETYAESMCEEWHPRAKLRTQMELAL